MIGATAVAGAVTLVLMIFTDWAGGAAGDGDDVQVSLDIQADGAVGGLMGRF